MNGIKFLLDTNFIIGLLKRNPQVIDITQNQQILLQECAYSFISRIELFSYWSITESEIESITALLDSMIYLPMDRDIEDTTIKIRRRYRLKMPDAIIAATAKVMSLKLLTLDQDLANRMLEGLE